MVAGRVARIDNLQGDCGAACDAVVVCIEAAGGQLVATATGASTIRLAATTYTALEELLIDGAIVDAGAAGPFPRILSAVTSAAHPAVVLFGS